MLAAAAFDRVRQVRKTIELIKTAGVGKWNPARLFIKANRRVAAVFHATT